MRTVVQFVLTARNRIRVAGQKRLKKGRKARPVQVDASPSNPDSLEFQPNVCSTPQRTQMSDRVLSGLGLGDQSCPTQFSYESSHSLLCGDQPPSSVDNSSLTGMPVSAQCEMSPALSTSDVHRKQTGSPSSCISTSNPDIQTHVSAHQKSFETPKKRRKLENSAEISVCENASASSVAGSTTSCSLFTLKSATTEGCLAKKTQINCQEKKLSLIHI